MSCDPVFSIFDGTITVEIAVAALDREYSFQRVLIDDAVDTFRAHDGTGVRSFRYEKRRYRITGAGIADPELWSLDLNALTWTVTIPGFANGSAPEVWTVLPSRPVQTRERGGHRWVLDLEEA